MVIVRWQAPKIPSQQQIQMMLELEGMEPTVENHPSQEKISEHRHPHTEIRIVLEGELIFSVSGNQFMLREGDRVEIPANTKHWHQNSSNQAARSIYCQKIV